MTRSNEETELQRRNGIRFRAIKRTLGKRASLQVGTRKRGGCSTGARLCSPNGAPKFSRFRCICNFQQGRCILER